MPTPLSPYGIAKLCAEHYIEGWDRLYGTDHVVLRFSNVYGPRQDIDLEGGVIAIFLDRLRRGERMAVYGDGRQTRDFVYVSDVVAGLLAGGRAEGGVYNIASGVETSILDLVEACWEATGRWRTLVDYLDAKPADVRRSVLNVSHSLTALGWRPEVTLAQGLARTWGAE